MPLDCHRPDLCAHRRRVAHVGHEGVRRSFGPCSWCGFVSLLPIGLQDRLRFHRRRRGNPVSWRKLFFNSSRHSTTPLLVFSRVGLCYVKNCFSSCVEERMEILMCVFQMKSPNVEWKCLVV